MTRIDPTFTEIASRSNALGQAQVIYTKYTQKVSTLEVHPLERLINLVDGKPSGLIKWIQHELCWRDETPYSRSVICLNVTFLQADRLHSSQADMKERGGGLEGGAMRCNEQRSPISVRHTGQLIYETAGKVTPWMENVRLELCWGRCGLHSGGF